MELSSLQFWCWMSTFCGKFVQTQFWQKSDNFLRQMFKFFLQCSSVGVFEWNPFRRVPTQALLTAPTARVFSKKSDLSSSFWSEFWFLIWFLVSDLIWGRENGDGRSDVNWTIKSEPLPVISDRASRSATMGGISQANALSFVTKINLC